MLTHEQISKALKDRRINVVAKRTGLSFPTIKRVSDMEGTPSYKTLVKLSDYLEGQQTDN